MTFLSIIIGIYNLSLLILKFNIRLYLISNSKLVDINTIIKSSFTLFL